MLLRAVTEDPRLAAIAAELDATDWALDNFLNVPRPIVTGKQIGRAHV